MLAASLWLLSALLLITVGVSIRMIKKQKIDIQAVYILSEWKETIPLSEDQKLIKELRALIKEKDKKIEDLEKYLVECLSVNEYFKGFLAGTINNYSSELNGKATDVIAHLINVRNKFNFPEMLDKANEKDKKQPCLLI